MSRSSSLSRRSLLSGFLAAACGRKRANRFPGWIFVSSLSERAIAVADLADFRRIGTINLGAMPCALLRINTGVVVICSEPALAMRIDPARMAVVSRLRLPGKPAAALVDGARIVILAAEPDCLLVVDQSLNRIAGRIPLPGRGESLDVSGGRAAVSLPGRRSIARVSMPDHRILGETDPGCVGSPLRFGAQGKILLAGDPAGRQIVMIDWESGRLLARLPVAVEPRYFCFDQTGGQMFVTGSGADVVVIVAPYQWEVYETIPAGRAPGPMVAASSGSDKLLLVANTSSGDVTILDVETRQVLASVHVGDRPEQLLVTPGGEYALIVNGGSGAIAVIRLQTVLNPGENALTARGIKPLFTVLPIITAPQNAIVVPYSM